MPKISYIDGSYCYHNFAYTHIEDRGLQFSDGVYEVLLIKNGKLVDFEQHLNRLFHSLESLNIKHNFSRTLLEKKINLVIQKNHVKNTAIYLQISRGVQKRSHSYSEDIKPILSIQLINMPTPSAAEYENGKKVVTHPDLRWQRRDIKSISLLPNILAKQFAKGQNAEESILIDNNIVTEGSSTNIFIVKNNKLITHPANHKILHGVTRGKVLKIAKNNNINVVEQEFTFQELLDADEVFITSTTKHILPINQINEKKLQMNNIVTKKLIKIYFEDLNENY